MSSRSWEAERRFLFLCLFAFGLADLFLLGFLALGFWQGFDVALAMLRSLSGLGPLALGGCALAVTGLLIGTARYRSAFLQFARRTRELEKEKGRCQALLTSLGDGVVATDEKGRIMLMNQEAEILLGWKAEEAHGKSGLSVVRIDDEKGRSLARGRHPLRPGKTARAKTVFSLLPTFYLRRKDSTRFPMVATCASVVSEGQAAGAVLVFRDMTREKEVDRAKTEFVGLASHQLRTPLTAVRWYADMLLAGIPGAVNDKQREYLDLLYQSNQRMVELVDAFLRVSRIDLGTLAFKREQVDVVRSMRAILQECRPVLRLRGLHLKTRFTPSLPVLQTDQKLLEIVFDNLVSNAVKYTPKSGTVTVVLEGKRAGERAADRAVRRASVFLTVSDTGYGIPFHQQNQVFTKLFRADNVIGKETSGTGLGLYTTKAIVDQAGGEIWFRSEEGKGTAFYVLLPLKAERSPKGT